MRSEIRNTMCEIRFNLGCIIHQISDFKFLISICCFFLLAWPAHSQNVRSLNANNVSLEYYEAIGLYRELDDKYGQAKLVEIGMTDIGKPLHLFIISKDGSFEPTDISRYVKHVLFINNGIHPGEPDGIDASVRFAQDILADQSLLPYNVVICIVPVFNIGGALNRGCCSRANQNGPEEYGFRGNARNLDLNRDFIKCDASNTRSLIKAVTAWDPDILIDTHVSNGADYQYTLTMLTTQPDKLGGPLTHYLRETMLPALYGDMKIKGHEMSPYIHTEVYNDDPRKGIYDFIETPRYASGFCSQFGIISFVSETHMLKPFSSRVDATEAFLHAAMEYLSTNGKEVAAVRTDWKKRMRSANTLPLAYERDTVNFIELSFNGYESTTEISKVTGLPQMYYDKSRPYTQKIKYYNRANPAKETRVPKEYIVPSAWKEVIRRLKNAGVKMDRLERDRTFDCGVRYISQYETRPDPYEGRFLHYNIESELKTEKMKFYAGDYLIPTDQDAVRYIVETLEPDGEDSFFAWGFFDSILQQKEWFSSYVFDRYAEELLERDPELKKEFEEKRAGDEEFARDAFAQLYYLYKRSPLFERTLNRYPVGLIYK